MCYKHMYQRLLWVNTYHLMFSLSHIETAPAWTMVRNDRFHVQCCHTGMSRRAHEARDMASVPVT